MTSTPVRVSLDRCDAATAALHRTVLAGLPERFVLGASGPAEVAVVSGRDPAWPDVVDRAVRGGARGVLLTRPALADAGRVRELSAAVAGKAVVAVDTPYANDRTWTDVRRQIADDASQASLVDSVVLIDGDPSAALVDQLAAVAGLVDVTGLRLVHRFASGYLAATGTGTPCLTLAGVAAGVAGPGLSIDVVAADRRWQVRFDGTAPAVPTEVTLHDRTGAHTRPLTYGSGHRTAWERLHEAITGAGTVGWTLDALADTLAAAGRVLNPKEYAGE